MSKDYKEFGLDDVTRNVIHQISQNNQATMAILLSYIAHNFNYNVTERTQFELSPELKTLKISELNAAEPESPVVKA